MNILLLCNKIPYPLKEGGNLCIYNYIKGMHVLGHSITLLCINGSRQKVNSDIAKEVLSPICNLEMLSLNTNITLMGLIFNLFTTKSYHITRFTSPKFKDKINSLLNQSQYDIIQFEGIFVSQYLDAIKANFKGICILRAHNVEHQIWTLLASETKHIIKKWYFNLTAKRLKNFEINQVPKFDGIIAISSEDQKVFNQYFKKNQITSIPASIENISHINISQNNYSNLCHLSSYDWLPNIQGLEWFLNTIWPDLISTFPSLRLNIAGKNMPEEWKKRQIKGVNFIGEIDDINTFYNENGIAIVPLWSGSGIRIKILEAFQFQKLVISTSIGAKGIDYEENKHILIANDSESWINIFKKINENIIDAEQISKNGNELYHLKYTLKSVSLLFEKFFQHILIYK